MRIAPLRVSFHTPLLVSLSNHRLRMSEPSLMGPLMRGYKVRRAATASAFGVD